MPLGQRTDDMQQGMMSGPLSSAGVNSSFSSSMMDETDDYIDYMGGAGSPLGLSSESSNQDRSCTSTPVGADGSPSGERVRVRVRVSVSTCWESQGVLRSPEQQLKSSNCHIPPLERHDVAV